MLNFLKPKQEVIEAGSPVNGRAVPLSRVKDPTFGEGMMGKGIAIIPSDGRFCAPSDGMLTMVFESRHAFTLTTDGGVEFLVHIGLETVGLKGAFFEAHAKAGSRVKKGDLIITADLEKIREAGLDTITPVVVCNTDDFESVKAVEEKTVQAGDTVLQITGKTRRK